MPFLGEEELTQGVVISADASCSGKRAACAAVLSIDGQIVAERSAYVRDFDGYVLAAELAAVALASKLASELAGDELVTLEVDNPDIPRVILNGYRPAQATRIPVAILAVASKFVRSDRIELKVLRRNATPGLRRADKLANRRLWGKKTKRFGS